MYFADPFQELIINNKELVFIHTPKCAGSYVSTILSNLKIKNNGHNQATPSNTYIYFTVIRNPVERFESLLNYRLDEKTPRDDWPKHLSYMHYDKNYNLDEIISNMTNEEILGFSPYKTIDYWTKNVDIIVTLDNLPKMLKYFGYEYDVNSFKSVNVSNKIRGTINQQNKDRIKTLFNYDIEIYNMVINSEFYTSKDLK
jgi:hypothetical protein